MCTHVLRIAAAVLRHNIFCSRVWEVWPDASNGFGCDPAASGCKPTQKEYGEDTGPQHRWGDAGKQASRHIAPTGEARGDGRGEGGGGGDGVGRNGGENHVVIKRVIEQAKFSRKRQNTTTYEVLEVLP